MTVRDGHAAILTSFESRFGIRTSFDELLARALAHPDPEHAVWFEVTRVLGARQDEETWSACTALRSHSDPNRRLFAADLLFTTCLGTMLPNGDDADSVYERRALEFLLPWAAEETDPHVLAGVLSALSHHEDPRIEVVGLTYAEHPDPEIRGRVQGTIQGRSDSFSAEGWAVLSSLTRDTDTGLRRAACWRLAECASRTPGITDVLAVPAVHFRPHMAQGASQGGDGAGLPLLRPAAHRQHPAG